MGGCCAPGALGATTFPAMEERIGDPRDTGVECNGEGTGGEADQIASHSSTLEKSEPPAVNVEALLQALEDAVENEYVSMRDSRNAGGEGNADGHYKCEEKAPSPHCSSAGSPASMDSASGSVFSRSSSTKEKSPSRSNPGAGEFCNLENVGSFAERNGTCSTKSRIRTNLDWAERVEATLESIHDMGRDHPSYIELKSDSGHAISSSGPLAAEAPAGSVDKNLEQMLDLKEPLDKTSTRSTQSCTITTTATNCPRPVDVLSEFDDFPRGISDSNSEDAERERQAACCSSTPPEKVTTLSRTHEVGGTSFSLHAPVQCRSDERRCTPPPPQTPTLLSEGLMRIHDSSSSTADQRKGGSLRAAEDVFSSIVTSHQLEVQDGKSSKEGGDAYVNWLERHLQQQLNGKKESNTCGRKESASEYETCTKNGWSLYDQSEFKIELSGFKEVQGCAAGNEFSLTRAWANEEGGHRDQSVLEGPFATSSNFVRGSYANGLKNGEGDGYINTDEKVEHEATIESSCYNTTSERSPTMHHHDPDYFSSPSGEHVEGFAKHNVAISEVSAIRVSSHSALRPPMGVLSQQPRLAPESATIPGHSQRLPHTYSTDELRRSYDNSRSLLLPPSTCSRSARRADEHKAGCGVRKLQSPRVMLGTPTRGSFGGNSGWSKVNSRAGTPRSVVSEGANVAADNRRREKVKVCVRMRPFNDYEKICPLRQLLCVMGKKVVVKEYDKPFVRRSDDDDIEALEFNVDCVIDDSYLQTHRLEKKEESQRRMYESIGLPCLEYALDGYNTTIIAYGQVGTGKTHTMFGDGTDEGSGLMTRLGKELIRRINRDYRGEFEVQVSYLEIYQERIRDLLAAQNVELQAGSRCGSVRNCTMSWLDSSDMSTCEGSADFETASNSSFCVGTPRRWRPERTRSVCFDSPPQRKDHLKIREHPMTGPYVEGLLWKDVATWQDLETVILQGAANRTIAATPLNKFSSRGHTIFIIKLIRGGRKFVHGCPTSSFSVINLVDLAGTEKAQCARKTSLDRQDEMRCINRSLAQLNDVILNLSKSKFVSYRSSALTWLLRDSLGGDAKLFLIATVSPAEQDFQESVTTLRYASKANRIHRVISSYPDSKKQLFVSMKKEIQALHNLVHDLTKTKVADSVARGEFRRPAIHSYALPRIEISADQSEQ